MILAPLGSRRFVGRTGELAAFHERRRDLARRRGSVVLVGGPAGIGKSRLLAEFCRAINGGRAPSLLRAECIEYGGAPLEPVRGILAALPAGAVADVDAVAHDAHERGAFFRSIERILRAAAQKRSTILCIEDVHWADPATLEFLAYLAPRIAAERIMLVLTYRDDEIGRSAPAAGALARIARAPAVLRIALRPLEEGEMRELIDSALPDEKPPDRTLRNVIDRAEGNPFYAEELLKGVIEGDAPDALPQSIEGLVLERFAALDDVARAIVLHAAILGYRFDPDLLRALLDVEAATLARALRDARELNLVVEEANAQVRFRFRHALTHEAIVRRTLAFEARPLHARIARLLESLPDAPRRLGEIAYHWWKALDAEHAVPANEAAGDAALSLHAYRDAATFYERALSLSDDRSTQSRLCTRAGMAAAIQGDQSSAIVFYERALALELDAQHYTSAGEIVRRIAGRLVYAGREAEAKARLATFLQTYGERLGEVDALLIEGWPILIDIGGGGVRAWRERFVRSRGAETATGKDAWGLLLLEVNAHAAVGEIGAWRHALARFRPFTVAGSPVDRAYSLLAVDLTAAYGGVDGALARASIEETLRLCQVHGLESFEKYVYTCDAFDRYLHGDLRGAQSAAHKAMVDWDDANQRTNMAVVGPAIGLDLDDPELIALAQDDGLAAALNRDSFPNATALAAGGVAARLLSLGRKAEAESVLERAVEALETLFGAQLLLPLAAAHVRTERARERIEELLGAVCDDDTSGHATRAMVRAVFAARDRAPDRVELARAAVARYAALGWPLLEAQALELAGEAVAARELYMRCGSLRHVRRLTRGSETSTRVAEVAPPLAGLSARERDVALAAAAGLSNAEIARRLTVSVKTVESHLTRIYARLGLRSRAQLASIVARDDRKKA
jgi:DNA-binding NarL/FixJ family response regulator